MSKLKPQEELLILGQEDEKKGIEATKHILKEKDESRKKVEETEVDNLNFIKSDIVSYRQLLSRLLRGYLSTVEWPKGCLWDCGHTKRGVAVVFKYRGKTYGRGFKPIMNELYDHNAVKVLATQVENTLGRLTGESDPEVVGAGGNGKTVKS